MKKIKLIQNVKPLEDYTVLLQFSNGEQKTIDLLPLLHGSIFEPIRRDMTYFRTIYVDNESNTICWENGANIDSDVLYGSYLPTWQNFETIPDHSESDISSNHQKRLDNLESLKQFQRYMRNKYGELPCSASDIERMREERDEDLDFH